MSPDLVVKDSDACWNFEGGTLCNVQKDSIPASFLVMGNITGIKGVKNCWQDENGVTFCSVDTKGKDGGKGITARAFLERHIPVPSLDLSIFNNRSPEKCDPEKDPFCVPK